MAPGILCAAAEDGFSKARSFCGATQLITCIPYYSVKLSSFIKTPASHLMQESSCLPGRILLKPLHAHNALQTT